MGRFKVWSHVPPEMPVSVPCRLAFVAEAPADEEVGEGRPLVGASGRVFNMLLRSAGIDRGRCLVTNVFDEQAPGNELEAWGWPNKMDPLFVGAHFKRLAAEIAAARPTVVVPLGAASLWAFTGLGDISRCRGTVAVATQIAPGTKVCPTLHPAHVIAEWALFGTVVGDLVRADAQAGFSEVRMPKREIYIRPTLEELRWFKAEWLDKADLLSVDIETAGGQITCIGFAPDATRAVVIPFVDFGKPNKSYWNPIENELHAWEIVREVLESPTPKLGQNFPYDFFWLYDRYRIRVRNYLHDTRLLHHALYPELPKSLAYMGATYAQTGPWKMMRQWKAEKSDE